MDLEKLIFIILALVISIFSMFMKAKKQKHTVSELQENPNITAKIEKKKQKPQKIEKKNPPVDNSKIISQDIDLETEISLLEDFEGTELQKAFLFSEIFKTAKN